MRPLRLSIVCVVLVLLAGCSRHTPLAAEPTGKQHGEVGLPRAAMCANGDGQIDWGDGTKTDLFTQENSHTYAYNGSYSVTVKCDGIWPFADRYVTRANVNDAAPAQPFLGLSGAGLTGLAALITAIIGVLTFYFGLKRGKAGPPS